MTKTDQDPDRASTNYAIFRDCLSEIIIQRAAPANTKSMKRSRKAAKSVVKHDSSPASTTRTTDTEELGEFIEYLASEIFPFLPLELQTLSYAAIQSSPILAASYEPPLPKSTLEAIDSRLPPSTHDSLTAYGLILASQSRQLIFLDPLLTAYTTAASAPPPPLNPTNQQVAATTCEICERDWVPLTYHHLVPRQMHAKAVKRGWCEEWEINAVAWLCRACHNTVHRVASNEELARDFASVERLLEREDVRAFAGWVSGVRWKSR